MSTKKTWFRPKKVNYAEWDGVSLQNNKENNVVTTVKTGSGLSSGQDALVRNQKAVAFRLKSRRSTLGITQKELACFVGVTKNAYQTWEASTSLNAKYLPKLTEKLKCSLDWLLMGRGPEPEPHGGENQANQTVPALYNKEEPTASMRVAVPEVQYSAIKDKLIRSQEKLIAQMETQITQMDAQAQHQKDRIAALEKDCADLLSRLAIIENKLRDEPPKEEPEEYIKQKAM